MANSTGLSETRGAERLDGSAELALSGFRRDVMFRGIYSSPDNKHWNDHLRYEEFWLKKTDIGCHSGMHGTRLDNHIKAPPSIAGDFSSDKLWERAQTLPKEVPYEIVRSFRLAFKQQLFGSHR